ncbi:MAG TPA: hypothetical protein ENJ82_12145 [Bacteroidetes bacterium]|nr:hypothetical protein [Bacteroidota bacterium]
MQSLSFAKQEMQIFIKYKNWFLASLVLLTGVFVWNLQFLRVDFSFDTFHPKNESESIFFQSYRDTFPHFDNAIQIALKGPNGTIWDPEFLAKVDTLFASFAHIPNVDTVLSPTRLEYYRRSGIGVKGRRLLRFDSEENLAKSKKILAEDSLLYFNHFSEDRKYIGGILLVDPEIIDLPLRDSVSYALRKLLMASGLENVVSGVPFIRTEFVEKVRGEITWFLLLSAFLTLAVMFLLYRKWWSMLLPLLGVGLSLVWMMGFLGLIGKSLDMVSELLPSIIFVVAISDIVHLFTRYQQDLHRGLDRKSAMKATLKEIGLALFLTSFTTAIGFASLYVSPLPPVKGFGLVAALGVIFAFVVSIIIIPNALMLIPAQKVRESKGIGNAKFWEPFLEKLHVWVRKNPWPIAIGFFLLLAVSGVGMSRISTNAYLLDDISEEDPARKSMKFFQDNFYGARAFEMAIFPREGHSMTDLDLLQNLDALAQYLHSQERMSPFLSIVGYLKQAHKIRKGGRKSHYTLPDEQREVEELIGLGYAGGGEKFLDLIMTRSRKMGRVSGRLGDIGTYKFEEIEDNLGEYYRTQIDTTLFTYHLTGTPILTDNNVIYLRQGLFYGLLLAFILISILMGVLFRSWRMLLIGVVPNIIPLLVTAGIMGFTGVSLRASTSIVFLVAFGIAVDDTIHFLSRLAIELREGRDLESAIHNTITGTGKALILTTIILFAGFVLLLTSDFGGTYVMGFFTALTLLVALVSDLLLLPVLVRWSGLGEKVDKKKK